MSRAALVLAAVLALPAFGAECDLSCQIEQLANRVAALERTRTVCPPAPRNGNLVRVFAGDRRCAYFRRAGDQHIFNRGFHLSYPLAFTSEGGMRTPVGYEVQIQFGAKGKRQDRVKGYSFGYDHSEGHVVWVTQYEPLIYLSRPPTASLLKHLVRCMDGLYANGEEPPYDETPAHVRWCPAFLDRLERAAVKDLDGRPRGAI